MRVLLAFGRLVAALWHALAGLATIVFIFPRLDAQQRQQRVQAWARQMLRVMGVGLQVRGTAAAGPVLIVANHISWLDILVLHAAHYCRFVSKSDVRRWPLVGRLATGAGTLYIERESRRDAMRVAHHMAQALRAGDVLAIFPEGTTSDGSQLLPFHANLLQAAITAGAPVQPVALAFRDAATGAPSRTAAYIGDDTLVGSLWRTLAGAPFDAVVCFGEPEHCAGRNRRAWAQQLREQVAQLRALDGEPGGMADGAAERAQDSAAGSAVGGSQRDPRAAVPPS
ncbi:lysophospholipid acyltransferase family protein [Ramlibacter sp. AN1015]|uniref:lysophospholipid acyltransferase family protein n=1 Tax=Ramlibacter sp. AN1015 TaxID=3133428 RepID=UPI0030C077AA